MTHHQSLDWFLQVAALVCWALGAAGVSARVSWVPLGLFLWFVTVFI